MEDNLFGNPEIDRYKWKLSGAWATKKINCCLSGIKTECGGCCHGKPGWTALTVWPMRAWGDKGHCNYFVEDKGCQFNTEERPVLCLLYPFMIDGKQNMQIYFRVLGGSCKKAYNTQDKTILEHFKDTFTHLFGVEQYERVCKDILVDGKPFSYFYPSEKLLTQIRKEEGQYENNIIPTKREDYGGF